MNLNLKNTLAPAHSNSVLADERGLSTVEYVVLLVLIVASAAALWNAFGGDLVEKLGGATKTFHDEVGLEETDNKSGN